MNVHLLVIETYGKRSVEVFTSRNKMVLFKKSLSDCICTMFPPIKVSKTNPGIVEALQLINRIHTDGEIKVLEEMEQSMEEIDDIECDY